MKRFARRAAYIVYRLAADMVSLASRFINATIFNGSTAQTLSARSYIEGQTDPRWRTLGKFINPLFFWQENHIRQSWEQEVSRAKYTLARLNALHTIK
mgnify:CR=1 FL=1